MLTWYVALSSSFQCWSTFPLSSWSRTPASWWCPCPCTSVWWPSTSALIWNSSLLISISTIHTISAATYWSGLAWLAHSYSCIKGCLQNICTSHLSGTPPGDSSKCPWLKRQNLPNINFIFKNVQNFKISSTKIISNCSLTTNKIFTS